MKKRDVIVPKCNVLCLDARLREVKTDFTEKRKIRKSREEGGELPTVRIRDEKTPSRSHPAQDGSRCRGSTISYGIGTVKHVISFNERLSERKRNEMAL